MKRTVRYRVLKTVKRTVAEFQMFAGGDAVLVGVSGGPDSMALLSILNELAPEYALKLAVAHLNHSLRPEADAEAAFVLSTAHRLDLACHSEKRDVYAYRRGLRLSIEEAARKMRYAFFDAVADRHGYGKIALGHHTDDNAESVLMYLVRGSGPAGFAGIPPVREGRIVRPLMGLTRRDIIEYLEAAGLGFVCDRTNRDKRFIRNRIRHHLLPLLRKSYNPRITEALNRLAAIQRDEQTWLDGLAAIFYRDVLLCADAQKIRLSIPGLRALPKAARRRVLRIATAEAGGDLRRVFFSHIEAALRLIDADRQCGELDFPGGLKVGRTGYALTLSVGRRPSKRFLTGSEPAFGPAFFYRVREPQGEPVTVSIREAACRMTFSTSRVPTAEALRASGQRIAFFDMHKLTFPLTLRSLRPGDRFTPLGLRGSQKIKKFFIDHKVPRNQRWGCPVLMSADRIVWLVGHRTAEEGKVTASTREVLRVEAACITSDRD